MSDETARIRLRIGQLEVEYDGTDSFIRDGLFHLVEEVVGFYSEHRAAMPAEPPPAKPGVGGAGDSKGKLDHSTNTIATLLGVKSGPDLIIAAAACFTLVQAKERFTRKELLGEMQTAASFYKKTYNNNLSKYLESLVKTDRLRLVADNTYAVSSKEKQALDAKLAE